MNLTKEKEEIKKEIDQIQDESLIRAIRQLLISHEDDAPSGMLNEPPIEDWEMVSPEGRVPTSKQLDEWLDKDEGKSLSGDEALKHSLEKFKEYKGKDKNK